MIQDEAARWQQEKHEADAFNEELVEAKKRKTALAGNGGTAGGGGDGAADEAEVPRERPARYDFTDCKQYAPKKVGTLIWQETRTNRCRGAYRYPKDTRSKSWKIDEWGVAGSIKECLKWLWQCHLECEGARCPWDFDA